MISNEPRWNSPNWFDMSVVKYKLVPEVDGGCNRQPFSGSSQPASENPCITPDRHYSDQNVKTFYRSSASVSEHTDFKNCMSERK